jgi:hypothetical protein
MFFTLLLLVFANTDQANCQPAQKTEKITLSVDMEKERRLQTEVDNGHQPWRLEPVDVAYADLISTVKATVPFEKCNLSSESANEAVVQCSETKNYIIKLKRLVRPKGIWTTTEIRIVK